MIFMQANDEETQRSTLVIVIERDNLERMEKADPITLVTTGGGLLKPIRYPNNLRFIVAYEPDAGPLYALIQSGAGAKKVLEYLLRNFKFEEKDGLWKTNQNDRGST